MAVRQEKRIEIDNYRHTQLVPTVERTGSQNLTAPVVRQVRSYQAYVKEQLEDIQRSSNNYSAVRLYSASIAAQHDGNKLGPILKPRRRLAALAAAGRPPSSVPRLLGNNVVSLDTPDQRPLSIPAVSQDQSVFSLDEEVQLQRNTDKRPQSSGVLVQYRDRLRRDFSRATEVKHELRRDRPVSPFGTVCERNDALLVYSPPGLESIVKDTKQPWISPTYHVRFLQRQRMDPGERPSKKDQLARDAVDKIVSREIQSPRNMTPTYALSTQENVVNQHRVAVAPTKTTSASRQKLTVVKNAILRKRLGAPENNPWVIQEYRKGVVKRKFNI